MIQTNEMVAEKLKKFFILEILLVDEDSPTKDIAAFENIVDITTSILKLQYIPNGWKTCLILAEATSTSTAIEQLKMTRRPDIREAKILSVTNTENEEEMTMFLTRYRESGEIQYYLKKTEIGTYQQVQWHAPVKDIEFISKHVEIFYLYPKDKKVKKKKADELQAKFDPKIQKEILTRRTNSISVQIDEKASFVTAINGVKALEEVEDFNRLNGGANPCFVFCGFTINQVTEIVAFLYQGEFIKHISHIDFFCTDPGSDNLYRIFFEDEMIIKRI